MLTAFFTSENPHKILTAAFGPHAVLIKRNEREHQNPSGSWKLRPIQNGGLMKRNLVLLSLVAAITLTAGFSFSGSGVAMRVSVPFDFYLENQLFPAGEYRFEMGSCTAATSSSVTVWALEGKSIKILTTRPGSDADPNKNTLHFNKYDDKYFLSTISISGHKATLKVFKLERELRSRLEIARNITTVAQN
jgi:hypothetical protein